MTAELSLQKVYSDRQYTHTTMVRHQGTAFAFALDGQRRIVYTVLDLSVHENAKGELDAAYWSESPVELPFPGEIVKVGYAVAGATAIPVVKRGGRTEAGPDELLAPEETDPFLSSTARLTAPAVPFQVLSDGTYVVVLRQAVDGGHADAVHVLTQGGSSGSSSRTDYVRDSAGAKVPVAASTLLCDRFLFVGGVLKPVSEVRFRRSRHKTSPESTKDSLGAADMDGKPFFEPTQELAFVRNLTGGRFSAVLTPTAVQGRQRWQFFAHNSATKRIDSFNVEQGAEGLFNTQGTRYWTSPDPQYQASVYERTPGTCPFTGRPLVPVVPEALHAESAVAFPESSPNHWIDCGTPALGLGTGPYTVEAWVKPGRGSGVVVGQSDYSFQKGFRFRVYTDQVGPNSTPTDDRHLELQHPNGSVWAYNVLKKGAYAHIAASYDGTTVFLYVDGALVKQGTLARASAATTSLSINSSSTSGGGYSGVVDEVRIWNRARSQTELEEERTHRLIGNEPGLVAYYRFDEASGTKVYDQTDTAAHGTFYGSPAWVASEAPVGDHPGVRRDSFTLDGRDVVSGLTASVYYQQERLAAGHSGAVQPAKRQARVLLACATRPTGNTTAEPAVATVDFGIGVDGRLAQIPDVVTLTGLPQQSTSSSSTVDTLNQRISTLQTETDQLGQGIVTLRNQLAALGPDRQLPAEQWVVETLRHKVDLSLRSNGTFYGLGTDGTTTDGAPIALLNRMSWWYLLPLPGRTCTVAIVDVSTGSFRVLEAENGGTAAGTRLVLKQRSFAQPLPASAQWAISNPYQMENRNQRFQHVASGKYLGGATLVDQSAAPDVYTGGSREPVPDLLNLEKHAQEDALHSSIADKERQRAAKGLELDSARDELARLTDGAQGAADVTLKVPLIGVDASGLSVSGALLTFAKADSTPFLLDSAAGRVALYYRGSADSQFYAAYLDTATVRSTLRLTGTEGPVLFTARDPGVDISKDTTLAVTAGAATSLCTLTITRGGESETFRDIPRRARELAAVINGLPDEPVRIGTVATATGRNLTLATGTPLELSDASYLQIGAGRYRVTSAVQSGATAVTVATDLPTGLTNAVVSLVHHDPGLATASRPGVSLARGSRWIAVGAQSADTLVPNGTAGEATPGHGTRWRGDSPGRALSFDGTVQRLSLPDARLPQLAAPAGDLSLEIWAKPDVITTAPGRQRLVQLESGETKAALMVLPAARAMVLNGSTAMSITNANPTNTDFTIECWLKRSANRANQTDTIVSCGTNGLTMGFTTTGAFSFGFGTGSSVETLTTTATYTDTDWHHWAVTFNRTTKVQTIHRDGAEVARRTATTLPASATFLIVGRADSGGSPLFNGHLAELRTWNTARSDAEITARKDRPVIGDEAGLTGAWSYRKGSSSYSDGALLFTDRSPSGRNGGLWGNADNSDSPLGYQVVAKVGDRVRISDRTCPIGEWSHLAAVFEQSWGIRLDGSSWAEAPDADQLDLTEDLTVEVFARIDTLGSRQGLVAKGALGDSSGTVPYQFSVLPDGRLEFAFEEPGPSVRRYTSATAITAGFHRLAVVRRGGKSTEQVKGTKDFTFKDADGREQTKTVEVIDRVDTKSWDDIVFVADGTEIGTGRYTGPGPRGSDGTLEIGRARSASSVHPLTGAIGEVRIWSKARDTAQLGTPLQPRDEGLVARWSFEENAGSTTADPAGGHTLRLRGARWTTDPDPQASTFRLYRDGQPLPSTAVSTTSLQGWSGNQLTLGAINTGGTTFADFFRGTLEEVRIWQSARTQEQILDNLFTRLKGEKKDLLAYWPFDSSSTTTSAATVADHSLRGNHLDLGSGTNRPTVTLSSAPVSTDTSAVRSALGGGASPFQRTISAPPAAAEYADLQYAASGEAFGVLKRCYSHLKDGTWSLITGYKVGDLVSEWVSQVQFDPQLIGYIEGAPPVPSENLTSTTTTTEPAGCSSVTFQQADEVVSTLSSDRERSVNTSFSMSAGIEVDEDILMITAPLGIGTAQPLASIALRARIGGSVEFSNAWTDETSVSQGTSTEHETTATLTGHWEDRTRPLNSVLGQRYVPTNQGYALVQSETADVYALRLAHSGTLVAYRITANPDIPKDWNIISFPINPQYTKQGTLDGAVGFNDQGKVLDPAYPTAGQYGEYSYFKPREAYALKRRILRERQELETYYGTVSTETHDADPTQERAARLLDSALGSTPNAPGKIPPTQSAGSFANRNIANTYVWTADGGFFAETTGTTDVVTQTTGGSYSLTGSVTTSLEVDFEIAGIGAGLQFDASVGGGLTVTRHRSKEATRSHRLNVVCNPTNDLQKYDAAGKPVYAEGKPVLAPGKVDAYRFMTFYLGQDSTHFDDFYNKVADPVWLANSADAGAVALRQARQSDHQPPCWRVLHRVTYISRILPPVPPPSAPPIERAMKNLDISSNYELIRRLDPYVSSAATTRAHLAGAVRTALTLHLPQLLPHAATITVFLADYYDVTD
ncbi:LamG-like jellyroll fold domain-containing protein [Streptomyces sp. NPDC091377]|uniref:LamG-like jellyroll fold domain-containing protein n=1 Tax=Streptomyces sp. NPDC091377 TaxID=3365995 RepID=UPI00380E5502